MKRAVVNLIILTMVLFSFSAFAGNPCDEYKELRSKRISFDIEMRLKRIPLREKLAKLRLADNDLERAIADIETEILACKEDVKEESLWAKYDELSNKRESISNEYSAVYEEYAKISNERTSGKMEIKKNEIEKRYECALNTELNEKIDKLSAEIGKNKRLSKEDQARFETLSAERKKVIAKLEEGHKAYLARTAETQKRLNSVQEQLKLNNQAVDKGDKDESDLSDAIYNSFDSWTTELGGYKDNLKKVSKEMQDILESVK